MYLGTGVSELVWRFLKCLLAHYVYKAAESTATKYSDSSVYARIDHILVLASVSFLLSQDLSSLVDLVCRQTKSSRPHGTPEKASGVVGYIHIC